jgi:glycogen debranching enzyme
MTIPTALNSGEPARIGAGGDTVTLVEGATFFLSDRHGDVVAGGSHGLFFRDTRVLSRWELRVDGQVAESLSVESTEAFAAQFILRRTPRAGLADSTLLVVRERLVADGLREVISLHNLDRESTVVSLELHADADFADLFSVKEGRVAPRAGAEMAVVDGELILLERTERVHGLSVTASGDPIVVPGSLRWRVVVAPGQCWQTEIVAQPTWDNQKITTRLGRGEHVASSAPARKIEAWRDTATNVETGHQVLNAVLRQTEGDLGALLIHDDTGRGRSFVAAGVVPEPSKVPGPPTDRQKT